MPKPLGIFHPDNFKGTEKIPLWFKIFIAIFYVTVIVGGFIISF